MTGIIPLLVSLTCHRPEGISHTDAQLIVLKCLCVCVCKIMCVYNSEVELLKCANVSA